MRRDLACAALGLCLAGAYWTAADTLPKSFLADAVGADGVPKALAVLLAIFSVLIALRSLSSNNTYDKKDHLRALGIAVIGFAYVAVASFIGYLISVALLSGGAALYYGAPRKPAVALFAIGTAALLWLVFGALLGIALPG